ESSFSAERPTTRTLAPERTKAFAAERPRPEVPPMTTMTLPVRSSSGRSASDFGTGGGGQSGAEVPFAGRAGNGDDHFASVLRTFCDFDGGPDVCACGDADEKALFLAEALG